jgi:hypothetical protein
VIEGHRPLLAKQAAAKDLGNIPQFQKRRHAQSFGNW